MSLAPLSPVQQKLVKSKTMDQYLDPDAAASHPFKSTKIKLAWPHVSDGNDASTGSNDDEAPNDQRRQTSHGPTEDEMEAAALFGYEDAAPSVAVSHNRSAQPRRSSLSNGRNRRASIGYSGEVTLRLPSKETVKRRTSITFDDTKNEIHEVEGMSSLTDHPERLWFQDNEYAHIQDKIYAIINKLEKDKDNAQARPMFCTRGLEPLMRDHRLERRDAYDSVFDEQASQRKQGRFDDTSLSQMYVFHTIDSKVSAAQRGEEDEAAIANYTKSTRRMMRRLSC